MAQLVEGFRVLAQMISAVKCVVGIEHVGGPTDFLFVV